MENELETFVNNSNFVLPGLVLFILAFWLTFTFLGYSVFKIATGASNFLLDQHILFHYRLTTQEKGTLEYNNAFYRNLNGPNKRKFECNVKYFIHKKIFEGKGGLHITAEMKLLVAATATQIAFGHFPTIYEHFRRIVIYPDKYFSGTTQRYHLGEVQSNGVIKLSWKAFIEGAQIKNDGIHVGYHEMAHALKIEDSTLHDTEHCFMDKAALRDFHHYATDRIRNHSGNAFMRDYAFCNSEELFAVSIEYFFEMPNQLRKNEPEIYNYLTIILNLDPINHQNPILR
jgi:Mlc titration factor MtfA (ptsG expression regulator)